jgi:hypothetical protein
MGLIAEGRSDEILLNPVYSIELLIETRLDLGMTAIPSDEELAANSGKGYASLNEYLAAQTTTNSYEIR